MAAPAFSSSGAIATSLDGANTTAEGQAPVFPASVAADDIAFLQIQSDTNTIAVSFTGTYTDWAQVGADVETSGFSAALYWRRCSGAEDGADAEFNADLGTTSTLRMAQITTWSGALASGTPYEDAGEAHGTGTTATSGSTTTTDVDRLGIRFFCVGDDGASAAPSGWNERIDNGSTTGADGQFAVDDKTIATASTEAASARTVTTGPWIIFDLALKPPVTAITPVPGAVIAHIHRHTRMIGY